MLVNRRRAARALMLILGLASVGGPATAAHIASRLVYEAPAPDAPFSEGVLKPTYFGWPPVILYRKLRAELAVRVTEEAVVPAGWSLTGKPQELTLKAGDLLTGGSDQPGIYCTVPGSGARFHICLRDADGDGKFESSQAGFCAPAGNEYDIMGWSSATGPLCTFSFSNFGPKDGKGGIRALPTPVGYAKADPKDGPYTWANLTFHQVKKTTADQPGRFFLEWAISPFENLGKPDPEATFFPQEFDIPAGGVGEVTVGRMVIAFLGLTPDGGLRYRVTTPPQSGVVRVQHRIVKRITVVLP